MPSPLSQPRALAPARRRLAAVSVGVAAAVVVAGCSSSSPKSDSSGSSSAAYTLTASTPAPVGDIDAVTWSVYSEPTTMDYAYGFDYPDNQVIANVCESLLRWNADLTYSPGLAEKVTHPNPTTWVYDLRAGVTFHDGTPLTAKDAVASMQRHLDPDVGSYWTSAYTNVKEIAATGPLQVTVTLTQPDAGFNDYMAAAPGVIESAATLEKLGADYGTSKGGVNCTGPFSFVSWTQGQSIVLKRFDNYWDKDLRAKAGTFTFVFLSDPSARINAFESGEVDGGWTLPATAYERLKSSAKGKLYFGLDSSVTVAIVTNLKGALGSVKARQALAYALDVPGVIKAGEYGVGTPAGSILPDSLWKAYAPDQAADIIAGQPKYTKDLAKAKALAQEAGIAGKEITIITANLGVTQEVVTQALAQAARDIGLTVKLNTMSPEKYSQAYSDESLRAGSDLLPGGWYTSTSDPVDVLLSLTKGNYSNYAGWEDAGFEAAFKAGVTAVDPVAQRDNFVKAEKIVMEQLPWIPVYQTLTNVFLGSRITGVDVSVNYLYYPWAAKIGKAG